MGLFSCFQDTFFDAIGRIYGNTATWTPNGFTEEFAEDFGPSGDETQTATVLYKDATAKQGLSDNDYNVERFVMEYKRGDFQGLKQSVERGFDERVFITTDEGITLEFFVKRIESKYDGKTMIAYLNEI